MSKSPAKKHAEIEESLLTEADKNGLAGAVPGLDAEMRAEIQRASAYYTQKVFEYPALAEKKS